MIRYGRLALFAAAFLWGTSFVVMKNVLTNIPAMYILAIRFCGAALILLPVCADKLKALDKKSFCGAVRPTTASLKGYLLGGASMGTALLLGYAFQTYGLRLTTPGKNAFLTAVYCVIVPFLYWLLIKRRPDKYNAAAAVLCLAGVGFISLTGDMTIGLGDGLTLICGFFFAVHIIVTAHFVEGRSPVMLAMLQFAAAGILALVYALIFEKPPSGVAAADVWSMVFLTVICTAICLLLQLFGQKYTPPSQAAVIITFEAVFGAAASVILMHETLTARLALGFAFMFAAVIISETKLSFLHRAQKDKAEG